MTVTTTQQPVPGSFELAWATAQEVSTTSGGKLSKAKTNTSSTKRVQETRTTGAMYSSRVESVLGAGSFTSWVGG